MKKYNLLLCFLFIIIGAYGQKANQNVNIVFIGNSITYGARLADRTTEAPPVHASAYLQQQKKIGEVKHSNQGVSGHTTVDFLPVTNKAFPKVQHAANTFAADQDATLVFSVVLGTNDSAMQGPNGAPVSPENYRANLKTIANRLLADYPGCKIIFHRPIWYSPNTYNRSKYLQEGLDRLQTYFPELDALVKSYSTSHPKQVFLGDKKAFHFFKKNHLANFDHESGQQGIFYLHPNKTGAAALGKYWGKAIYKVIK